MNSGQVVNENTLKAGDKIKVTGIDWDSEGETLDDTLELQLPLDWEPGDDIGDLISDATGYCFFGYAQIEKL